MSHRAERGDEKVDILWTPARLRDREHRQNEQRRGNVENQVAPTIQDPKVRARPCGGNCRNGLRPRKSGDVLHVEKRANYSLEARRSSEVLGSPWAFIGAIFIIVVWGLTGPAFHFSDTWQLIINTGTTIVTFLMVFLIQNTQNRDAKAVHLKLDELIRAVQGARNQLVDLEKLSDDELKKLEEQFTRVRNKAAQRELAMDPAEEI